MKKTGAVKGESIIDILNVLEKEKNIRKEIMLETIENAFLSACKNHFGTSDNVRVEIDRETGEYKIFREKEVVEKFDDLTKEERALRISLDEAKVLDPRFEVGDTVLEEIKSEEFGRIATNAAKQVIIQKIKETERTVLFDEFYTKEKDIVTGIVQRQVGKNISVNLGRCDAMLVESEQVPNETFKSTERIKLYVVEVRSTSKGPKITVSRSHPELVKRLFEAEVSEIREGIVEIKAISREAGSRSKIAVYSHDPNIDAVGACVGINGARVNAVVDELRGEKVDIINWDENAALLIENALSPAKIIYVVADDEIKEASVIVPDYQLSLAIGKEGQNARLAARLTGYKIDIKSETQAKEAGLFEKFGIEYTFEENQTLSEVLEELNGEIYGEEANS